MTHTNVSSEVHQGVRVRVFVMRTWPRFGLTLAALFALLSLQAPRAAYANSATTPDNTTGTSVAVSGTCTDAVAAPTVVAISLAQGINETLGVMGTPVSGGQGAGAVAWSIDWTPYFNGTYKIQVTCYPDAPDPISAESGDFTVNYKNNYSNLSVSPSNPGAGWMPFSVVPGTETLAPVEDGDLVLVLQDIAAESEPDAESVDEYFAAGEEFSINFDIPSGTGKTPYALYCMADCQSWSVSGNTMTANVKTVSQVKSDGTEYASALGFLTSFSPNMVDVEGSHFSGIGVHYSDMSSTDPQQMTKKAGFSVDGFTGVQATFKMFAPNATLDWMGIPDPATQWTGYLGDEVTDTVVTKTQVAGGWIMEFSFTFASNKKPGAGRPAVESNNSGYWAEKFSGVVFDDSSGGNVSTGGNSFNSGADHVTLSGGFGDGSNTVCITPPDGFSVTGLHVNQTTWYPGASCYTSADGARVDFGISRDTIPDPIPTVAPTATPSGQTQGALTASGGMVSNAGSGVTLTFASGAVADGATATIRPLASGETSAIGAGFSLVDTVVEIVVRDASGNVVSDFSSNPVRMCFDYTAAQLLTAGGDTANLEVVRNPGLADEGAVASNRSVDSSAQQICVDVTQFSTWTVAARVPTALPVTGSSAYTGALVGIAAVLLLSGGLALGWRRRR